MSAERVIITVKDDIELEGYTIYTSLSDILGKDNIEAVIYHSTRDSVLETVLTLSKIERGNTKYIFIYAKDNVDALLHSIFCGIDALLIDKESYLNEKETLDYIVKKYKNSGLDAGSLHQDLAKLQECLHELTSTSSSDVNKLMNSDLWVLAVNKAMSSVENALTITEGSNRQLIDFVGEISHQITDMQTGHKELGTELMKLKSICEDMRVKGRLGVLSSFGTVSIPLYVKNVMYVKEMSPCRYLKSLLVGYQDYVRQQFNVKAKVLIVVPKSLGWMEKYSHFPNLSSDSISMLGTEHEVYVTYEPKKDILLKFLSYGQDMSIIIDCLHQEPLVTGAHITKFYGVGGISDAKRLMDKTKVTRIFFTHTGLRDALIIPTIQGYQQQQEAGKRGLYMANCVKLYQRIDSIMKVESIKGKQA